MGPCCQICYLLCLISLVSQKNNCTQIMQNTQYSKDSMWTAGQQVWSFIYLFIYLWAENWLHIKGRVGNFLEAYFFFGLFLKNSLYVLIPVKKSNALIMKRKKICQLWQSQAWKKPVQSFNLVWVKWLDCLPACLPVQTRCVCINYTWLESSTWLKLVTQSHKNDRERAAKISSYT